MNNRKTTPIDINGDAIVAEARRTLYALFTNPAPSAEDITVGRIAASAFASEMKDKTRLGAKVEFNFAMARELAADKEELKRFLEAAMPNEPIVRLVSSMKEKES